MNAMQQPSMDGLIETSATERGIKLEEATAGDLFSVYIDVFLVIKEMLKEDLEDYPEPSIRLIKQALNEILQKFEDLKREESIDKKICNDIILVLPDLQAAVGAVTKASRIAHLSTTDQRFILDMKDVQVIALLKCRDHVGDIYNQLKGG